MGQDKRVRLETEQTMIKQVITSHYKEEKPQNATYIDYKSQHTTRQIKRVFYYQ